MSGWNDLGQRKHHRKHHKRPDVAERGMDEEVHGFVTEALPPLNIKVKSTDPFIPNGSDAKAFEGAAFSERKHHNQHHKQPDIAERGMDEEVHGFCVDSLPPLNTRERSNMPFLPNGSNGQAFKGSAMSERKHHHHKRPDVAERGMDEEVHGFVTEALPPLNIKVKSTDPFIPNGSDPSAFEGAAFMENKHHHKHHKRPDIAERGMDEEVHGFCVDSLPPLNTRERSSMPFLPNGSNGKSFKGSASLMARSRKDIAERGMDEDVWGFATEAIPPLNVRSGEKEQMPWLMNGYKNQWAQVNTLAQ
jgi:secreted trypsin-like serine protease